MQHIRYTISTLAIAIMLFGVVSCQKVVDLKLNNSAAQLVIEANITDEYGPQVVLISQSVPFTNTNTFPPVQGAAVTVTDGDGKKYNFIDAGPGVYVSTPFKGIHGVAYYLTVNMGGKIYTATSTMPYRVNLDSVTAKVDIFGNKNRRTMIANYQDPRDTANQYRFILGLNSKQVNDVFANDDSFSDGRYVRMDLFQNATDIVSKDTVSVEMQCIDKNIYKYWLSLSQQQGNSPGGATTPSNPPSNLSNNALGYFSAHTTQVKSIIVY